jgi:heme exporter protein B
VAVEDTREQERPSAVVPHSAEASGGNLRGSLGIVWALARKDLLLEVRNRDVIVSIAGFTLLVFAIFTFAVDLGDLETAKLVGPGVLWAGIAFAGVIGLNRAFALETERDTLEGLMLTPVSRDLLFLGKALGIFLFLAISQAIVIPVFAVLFNLVIFRPETLGISLLATLGFSAVGTMFASMTVRVRAREIMLPLLFLPTVMPLLLAAIEATADVVAGDSWSEMTSWLQLAAGYDVVFVIVSALVFQLVLED